MQSRRQRTGKLRNSGDEWRHRMKIKTAEIQAVTGRRDQYPPDTMKEIAFAGRSNVGKSSLLNLLTGRKKLAKVSGSPGKTRTINFYLINNEFRIVDLPGYGYAKVAKSMSEDWGRMMDEYFQHRDGLVKVVQLVDIRHDPSKQDVQMYEYLKHFGLDGLVVATKSDKISRNEMQKNLARIRKVLGMNKDDILIPVSALKKTGHEQLLDAMEAVLAAAEGVGAEEPAAEQQSDS
jgi:GTP-binding protein